MKQAIIMILIIAIPLAAVEPAYKALEVFHLSLQLADMVSTVQILDHGGVELNPLMKSFTKSIPAVIIIKTSTSLAGLWIFRQVHKHSRFAAYASLIAVNIAMGFVVSRNVRILNRY